MPLMTGSRYFAEAMRAYEVTHVFLVPTILTPALAEMEGMGITRVTTHGEKSAVYMADGYARVSGKPGIAMSQAIGAANLAAGLRDPFLACSPVIAISAGRFPQTKHRHVYQEIDDFPLFTPLTKFSAQVELPERLPDLLRQAFRSATSGCPGPVYLQVAGNFGQAIEGQADLDGVFEPQFARYPAVRPLAEPQRVRDAAAVLARAERPVLVAGGGVRSSGAQAEVVQLAEKLSIPVATSLNAKGTIRENHPLSVGVVGLYSRDCANQVVAEADLVFFLGSHTGSQVTNSWQVPCRGTRVMQLDIDPQELGRNYPNVVSLCGDARAVLTQLLDAVEPRPGIRPWLDRVARLVADWRQKVQPLRNSEAMPLRPERICKEIEAWLPTDAVLVSDTGHAGIWSGTHIELHHPTQSYIRAAGSLGWGLPAALGAKCAAPRRTAPSSASPATADSTTTWPSWKPLSATGSTSSSSSTTIIPSTRRPRFLPRLTAACSGRGWRCGNSATWTCRPWRGPSAATANGSSGPSTSAPPWTGPWPAASRRSWTSSATSTSWPRPPGADRPSPGRQFAGSAAWCCAVVANCPSLTATRPLPRLVSGQHAGRQCIL